MVNRKNISRTIHRISGNKHVARVTNELNKRVNHAIENIPATKNIQRDLEMKAAYARLTPLIATGKARSTAHGKGTPAQQQKVTNAYNRDRDLIQQAGQIAKKLNAPGMVQWISKNIFSPLGQGTLSEDDALHRLEAKMGISLQSFSRTASNRSYHSITLRQVFAGQFGVGVETSLPNYPGLVIGALRNSSQCHWGLYWAGAVTLGTTIQAFAGIEFALWKCSPENITGWFTYDYTFRAAAIPGFAVTSYERDYNTVGWSFAPVIGVSVDMEACGEFIGGGGCVALLPGKWV